MPFQKATTTEDLWSGEMAGLSIDGTPVLLLNVDGVIRAYADWCPHQRSRLSAGSLKEHVLTCASHHWQFDVTTGHGINPKDACLSPIAVRVAEGEILVDVSEAKALSGLEPEQGEK
jgi:toluene monooxygenase system ferredoxin subunit